MIKSTRKIAAVSTELAIGIALSLAAVVIAIGLFSDNISGLITSSKISNIFGANSSKSAYDQLSRSYKNSQIEVQIMGSQGLDMLRKRANDLALDLIENPNTDTGPSVAYLITVIGVLVDENEPHICVYMNKESRKKCNAPEIGGYAYRASLSGNTLTLTRESDGSKIYLDTKNVPLPINGGKEEEIISNLTNAARPYILPYVALTFKPSTTTTIASSARTNKTTKTSVKDAPEIKKDLTVAIANLNDSLSNAHNRCTTNNYFANGESGCGDSFSNTLSWIFEGGSHYVNSTNLKRANRFFAKKKELLNNKNISKKDIEEKVLNFDSSGWKQQIKRFRRDHKSNPTSCAIFKDQINAIVTEYKLDIKVPACVPYGASDTDYDASDN